MSACNYVFLVLSDRLIASWCEGHQLGDRTSFDNDEAGRQALRDWLGQQRRGPARFLLDSVEEDFQSELIPRVSARERRLIAERKMAQLYRATPYRRFDVQGRGKQAGKEDRLLFSALTNADTLDGWLNIFLAVRWPVAGIYSRATLDAALWHGHEPGPHTLLITWGHGGLRQTYLQNGHLQFSRLITLNDHQTDTVLERISSETTRTIQYLSSMRLLGRNDVLQALVLVPGDAVAPMEAQLSDSAGLTYQVMPLDQLAKQHRLTIAPQHLADELLLTWLGTRPPANQYGPEKVLRFQKLAQTGQALRAMAWISIVVLLGFGGWMGWSLTQNLRQQQALSDQLQAAQQAHSLALAELGTPPASPETLRGHVDRIDEQRRIHGGLPDDVATLSQVIGQHPRIAVERMAWGIVPQAGDSVGNASDDGAAPPATAPSNADPASAAAEAPAGPFRVMVLRGHVTDFRGDYREANNLVAALQASLAALPGHKVDVVSLPIDVSSRGAVSNNRNTQERAQATFTLRLVSTRARPEAGS